MSALSPCRAVFPINLYSDITEIPMSLKHLTPDERATYLLGLAVRRELEEAPRDPDPETVREIAAVCRWLEHWLNERELLLIAQGTGPCFGDEGDEPALFKTTPIRRDTPARPNPDAARYDPEIPF
jgi:hypothetical protein